MTPNDIKTWRPRAWSDFVGAANHRKVRRLQQAAIRREPPGQLALIGPHGTGKTSLARHTTASFCCENPTGDGAPCCSCWECEYQGIEHNGMGYKYAHWELDCSQFTDRNEIRKTIHGIQDTQVGQNVAVFCDEFHNLHVNGAQSMLLKPSEDVHGTWIVAMTDEHYRSMDDALFERFRKVWLTIPTASEMVDFFAKKVLQWKVHATEDILRLMVTETQCSFRTCLDIVAAAAENDDRVLDRETLEEFLTLNPPDTNGDLHLF